MHSHVKLSTPVLSNVVRRNRLIQHLEQSHSKIRWVQAPPGYGKTTLLADLVEYSERVSYWYQVSIEDCDPKNLFHFLPQFLDCNVRCSILKKYANKTHIEDIEHFSHEFADAFYNAISGPFNLILDDFHVITNCRLSMSVFQCLFEKLPDRGNIYVSSRSSIPAECSRLYVNGAINVINAQSIQFNDEESRSLLTNMNVADEESRTQILEQSNGWAAGLVILGGDHRNRSNNSFSFTGWESNILSNYFSAEVTRKINAADLIILAKISIFPFFTVQMASELCELEENKLASVIYDLFQRNYFLECRKTDTAHYRFHPLFRQFLNAYLESQFETNSIDKMHFITTASRLLWTDKQVEEAAKLLVDHHSWQSLSEKCIEHAEYMLEMGRHETLLSWIEAIPDALLTDMPWLHFWKGKALLPFQPEKARGIFNDIFSTFTLQSDVRGQCLTCSAVADSYTYNANEFVTADIWIQRLAVLQNSIVDKIDISTESIVLESLLSLSQWQACAAIIPEKLFQRAETVLFQLEDKCLGIRLAAAIVRYSVVNGYHSRVPSILNKLKYYRELQCNSPINTVLLHYSIYVASAMVRDPNQEDRSILFNALADAAALNMNILQFQSEIMCIQSSVMYGDMQKAEEELIELKNKMYVGKIFDLAYFNYVSGWLNLSKSNISKARSELTLSLELSRQVSSLAPVHPLYPLITLEIEQLNFERAARYIDELEAICERSGLLIPKLKLMFSKVYYSLENNSMEFDENTCCEAIELCREHQIFDIDGRMATSMSRVFEAALDHDIEPDQIAKMILSQKLLPVNSSVQSWPWPVKIHVMGGIRLELEGEIVSLSKKLPKKVLSLLKLLVSKKGNPTLVSTITETLWDTQESAKGETVFKSTVSRLRKLLTKSAVIIENGYISLNRKEVWVDAWAIEQKCQNKNEHKPSLKAANLTQLRRWYEGDLLVDQDCEPWLISYKCSLQRKYLDYISHLAEEKLKSQDLTETNQLTDEIIRINDVNDTAYYLKIKSHIIQKNNAEALSTYRDYQQLVFKKLGVRVSDRIEGIISQIRCSNTLEH